MPQDLFENNLHHLLAAIESCMISRFLLPGLMLIYAAIDIMAWLNREESHEDVTRDDFILWTDTFLLPDSGIPCTGIDLYAARCSLLHSYSAESKLSREGKASPIYYAWGNAREQDLQRLIDWEGSLNAKTIHVDKLFAALKVGTDRFIAMVRQAELVKERANKFFTNMPTVEVGALNQKVSLDG